MAGEGKPAPATGGSSPPATQSPTVLLPAEHWAQLARDHENEASVNDDADSALGSLVASSTTSVTESILEYRTIHGRTYHSERGNAHYWFAWAPSLTGYTKRVEIQRSYRDNNNFGTFRASNDDKQNESMDIVHHFVLLSHDNKLHEAPLNKESLQNVLDIGTGTGIWAIDFADQYPNAEVIGTDISPIQPGWVPPNLKFEIEDCSEEWSFRTDSMDFVHIRFLFGSIKDWDGLFREAYRVCRPGGWFESYEATPEIKSDDCVLPETSALYEWGRFFVEGGKKLGRSFTVVPDDVQRKAMEAAGFVDIQTKNVKIPIGSWPIDKKLREIGQYVQLALEQDYEGYVLYMASQLAGWTMEEVTVYCAQLRREVRSGKYHPYFWYRVVYGRKPVS